MTAFELQQWQYELHDAAWANLLGDVEYAEWKLYDITKRYVYGEAKDSIKQKKKAKQKTKRTKNASASFRRRNSDTD